MISNVSLICEISHCVVVNMLLIANIEVINPCFCGFFVTWDTFVLIVCKSIGAAANVQLCVTYKLISTVDKVQIKSISLVETVSN